MAQVKLPQIKATLKSQYDTIKTEEEQWNQVNPSCLLAYLGIRGFANMNGATSKIVAKNALPILAYYDIKFHSRVVVIVCPRHDPGLPVAPRLHALLRISARWRHKRNALARSKYPTRKRRAKAVISPWDYLHLRISP